MRIQEGREILESRLFHGTKKSNVHNICMYNFDFRLAGCNGHRYGKGKQQLSRRDYECKSVYRH